MDIEARLQELKDLGLYRRLRMISGPQGPRVVLDGHELAVLKKGSFFGEISALLGEPAVADVVARLSHVRGANERAGRDFGSA